MDGTNNLYLDLLFTTAHFSGLAIVNTLTVFYGKLKHCQLIIQKYLLVLGLFDIISIQLYI